MRRPPRSPVPPLRSRADDSFPRSPRCARRYNRTKKGLELLRRPGTLARLQAVPADDEDDEDEDGPLEGLAQLRDVVQVLRRMAGRAR